MKTSTKRIIYLLLIALIAVAAAITVAVASRTSSYDGEFAAASSPDAQLDTLAAENGGIMQIVTGSVHTVILFENGALYGTENNEYGQLGLGAQ